MRDQAMKYTTPREQFWCAVATYIGVTAAMIFLFLLATKGAMP